MTKKDIPITEQNNTNQNISKQETDNQNQSTADETVEISRQELETLQTQLATMTDTAKRAIADLQNYKKQAEEEKSRLINLGEVEVLKQLMPVIDNFSLAFTHIPKDSQNNDWIKGIQQIQTQLLSIFKNIGLEEIPSVGFACDPHLHEAISIIPGEKNQIIHEIEKGYTFNGKVLKASKVIVGNGEAA